MENKLSEDQLSLSDEEEGRDLIFLKYEELFNKSDIHQMISRVADLNGLKGKEFSVTFCDNETIRDLNRQYRNIDKPTDVLSFVLSEAETAFDTNSAGDIIISVEKVSQQAKEQGITLNEEIKRMLIHGILHLAGFDHETDDQMITLQEKILNSLDDVEVIK